MSLLLNANPLIHPECPITLAICFPELKSQSEIFESFQPEAIIFPDADMEREEIREVWASILRITS